MDRICGRCEKVFNSFKIDKTVRLCPHCGYSDKDYTSDVNGEHFFFSDGFDRRVEKTEADYETL